MFNSVHLLWILGHSDIPGNETDDQYAKQAASQDFVGPEPALGIPTTKIRSAARLWANAQQRTTTLANHLWLSAGKNVSTWTR